MRGLVNQDKESEDINRKVQARAFENLKRHLGDIPSILYYNAPLKDRRTGVTRIADMVWIHPHAGILVIEVKAWDYYYLANCKIGDDGNIYLNGKNERNPVKQAIAYRNIILDLIKGSNYPVSYVVYFPNLTREEFRNLPEDIKHFIPEEECIFRGDRNVEDLYLQL